MDNNRKARLEIDSSLNRLMKNYRSFKKKHDSLRYDQRMKHYLNFRKLFYDSLQRLYDRYPTETELIADYSNRILNIISVFNEVYKDRKEEPEMYVEKIETAFKMMDDINTIVETRNNSNKKEWEKRTQPISSSI